MLCGSGLGIIETGARTSSSAGRRYSTGGELADWASSRACANGSLGVALGVDTLARDFTGEGSEVGERLNSTGAQLGALICANAGHERRWSALRLNVSQVERSSNSLRSGLPARHNVERLIEVCGESGSEAGPHRRVEILDILASVKAVALSVARDDVDASGEFATGLAKRSGIRAHLQYVRWLHGTGHT